MVKLYSSVNADYSLKLFSEVYTSETKQNKTSNYQVNSGCYGLQMWKID